MFDISLVKFVDPIEITRNNWIIGYYWKQEDSMFYDIHFCNGDSYEDGLLIDDVWGINDRPYDVKQKTDIYIVDGCSLKNDFTLDIRYTSFLKYDIVHKKFVEFNQLNSNIKNELNKFKNLSTSFLDHKPTPVISVITTVYNNALLLEQTIQSVINQSTNEYEYIIKDACSTDNFDEIVVKYEKYGVRVVKSKDRGIYDGMDQGFKVSSGEYIQILNSDDVFSDSGVIVKYIEEIKRREADAYCSDIVLCYPDGTRFTRRPDLKKLRYQSCINHTSLALKNSDYVSLGGFDKNLYIAADCDLTIKMVKAGLSIKYIPLTCVYFRMGGASSGISLKQLKEGLICRYRYSKWNIDGIFYTLLQFLKNRLLNR